MNSSAITDWLLREDEGYRLISALFLRLLALVYLAAFISTAMEITGLVGENGILPAAAHLAQRSDLAAELAWLRFPTLFWLTTDNWALLTASYAGCLLSILLLIGWQQRLCLVLLFLLYLSLYQVGQIFFNFQWEYLLLEAGLLAIFLVGGANRLVIFLLHLLLFRLRFLSGYAKVAGGDPSWSGLTTLNHYFETQPLPHMGAWYAHQLPDWVLRAGTGATLFVELIVPFFIFLPRPFRLFAAVSTIGIQLAIIATSNHNFVNLLTIGLCLFLLDDRVVRRIWPGRKGTAGFSTGTRRGSPLLLPLALVLISTSVVTSAGFLMTGKQGYAWDHPVQWVRGWGVGQVFHIFPNMQTERQELVIQGSHDGHEWKTYDFRFKADFPEDRPRFAVPLHPRLDWMMWFLPPQNPYMRHWFEPLMFRLHRNEADVTALLRHNPFADKAPTYLRVLAYRYRFRDRLPDKPDEPDEPFWEVEYLGLFPNVPPRRP